MRRALGLALVTAAALLTAPASARAPAAEPVRPLVQQIDLGTPEAGALAVRRDRVRSFSAYALTWAGTSAPERITARVRHHTGWTPWRRLDVDPPARRTARSGAGLVWTGPSDGIELRTAGGAPRDLRLELIDPRDAPADRRTRPEAAAEPEQPEIFRRADWGADESKMTWDPEYADTLSAIALHHTATSNDYRPEDVPKILRSIYHYHAVSLDWGDIGYHVLVDRYGRLWEGRTGGLRRPVIGAHAGGFNTRTAGISVIGMHTDTAVPEKVVDAAARYVAWRFAPYGIDPRGTTRLTGGPNTKYDRRVTVSVPRVFPHRQTSATECPGAQGVAALGPIRDTAYRYGG